MKIEVSNGELLDKISILEVKLNKIKNTEKLINIKRELNTLLKEGIKFTTIYPNSKIYKTLKHVNSSLWSIEDKLRKKEVKKEFDNKFIQYARKVYYLNDLRFNLKNEINELTVSQIREVKEYVEYKQGKK